MIYLNRVSKAYGSQQVLKDFTLEIKKESRIALMGRSGAGKTTILGLITGLVKPDSGKVEAPKDLRIGMVFQEDRLIESLSAEANCRLAASKAADPLPLLEKMGLDLALSKKPVRDLSGGERRRAAIARALLCPSDVIILDEPFKGIDAATLPSVIDQVNAAANGKAIILVTHTAEEAKALRCEIIEIA